MVKSEKNTVNKGSNQWRSRRRLKRDVCPVQTLSSCWVTHWLLLYAKLSLMTVQMSDGLQRKTRLTDKLHQLPGYLPSRLPCDVIARSGGRGGRKTEFDTL